MAGDGRRDPRGDLRVGIDVGGTNTDAVVLDAADRVVAWTKQATTADVTDGMRAALGVVLEQISTHTGRVGRVMLGTTHATNAILERRGLGKVAAVRIGAPATTSVPPFESWPADLHRAVSAGAVIVRGGRLVDGHPIAPLDTDGVRRFLEGLSGVAEAVAVTGVFSPAFWDQELEVAEIVRAELGAEVPISLSHEIGTLGLIERENATILNATLHQAAGDVVRALQALLEDRALDVAPFFAQNDGTLMALEYASRYPVLTIGSGPANSIRGAAFLAGVEDAVVADVGGTSTDLGVLVAGFPRESAAAVDIGGVRTNFRMPDILSLAIGGGTKITGTRDKPVLGPTSVGYRIGREALVFGGVTATLTDAAVAARRASVGSGGMRLDTDAALLAAALRRSDATVADAVDRVGLGRTDRPVVAVGGGAFLIPDDVMGARAVLRPMHGDVANAVGAAIALVSGRWETIAPAGAGRAAAIEEACARAVRRAIQAGAEPGRVEIVERTEVPLTYLPEPAVRVAVKAAGPLALL